MGKRREKFAHCKGVERSRECIDCEKSKFLHYLGKVDGAMEDVAQTTASAEDPFTKAILSGDIHELRDAGYRVHPEQAMRYLNKAWDVARCSCVEAGKECTD